MSLLKPFLGLSLLMCSFGDINAQFDVALSDSIIERRFTLQNLAFYEDKPGELTFAQISASEFSSKFTVHPDYIKKEFAPGSTYWVRMRIAHNSQSKKVWILEFFDQTIDEITAYLPEANGSHHIIEMGDHLVFHRRELPHKNFSIILTNQNDSIRTYYFKIRSQESADVRIVLRSLDQFLHWASTEYLLFGIFYGMLLVICFYNLLMYVAIRESQYGLYILYLISIAIYSASRDGIAYQFLWPIAFGWNQISIGVTIFCVALFAVVFTRSFLSTATTTPIIDKLLLAWIVVRSLVFLYALFIDPNWFHYRIIEMVPLILILVASTTRVKRGYKPARFMVFGHGVLLVTFVIKALVDNGMLPFNVISHYSLRIGFLIEMIFLSFALGDQIRVLKKRRDKALKENIKQHKINAKLKDKVNRELEAKVAERTKELEKKGEMLEVSNQKLIDQSNEINQINSMLDLENWKLRRHVREVLEERLVNKQLTFDEFQEIFPNKIECLRYLEKLKWKEGFQCRKCGNQKHFRGSKKFDHRCTRCGYNESITAHTVFRGIKFPIEKAFFILYTLANNHREYTLEELSEILDLRKNTIWSFKNKIVKANRTSKPQEFFSVVNNLNEDTPR